MQPRTHVHIHSLNRVCGCLWVFVDVYRGVELLAKRVLSLDYETPKAVTLGNWESETLTNMQLSCAALDSWVPLQVGMTERDKDRARERERERE